MSRNHHVYLTEGIIVATLWVAIALLMGWIEAAFWVSLVVISIAGAIDVMRGIL